MSKKSKASFPSFHEQNKEWLNDKIIELSIKYNEANIKKYHFTRKSLFVRFLWTKLYQPVCYVQQQSSEYLICRFEIFFTTLFLKVSDCSVQN